ncbi:MAG: hypothetical protein QM768_18095 [Agriterribacter sp.]
MSNTGCKKDGKQGEQGPPGTANVRYSEWFTPAQYQSNMVFGIRNFSFDKPVTEISQAIIDSGTVLTFGKMLGYSSSIWPVDRTAQLPILLTYVQSGTSQTDTWSAFVTPGNLRINFTNSVNTYTAIATTHQFRYIIIPGGQKVGKSSNGKSISLKQRESNFNQLSYQEICRMFNIPE